jgi:hypothetical protein
VLAGNLQVRASDGEPGVCNAAARGQVYFDSGSGHFMGCTGQAWTRLSGNGGGGGQPQPGDRDIVTLNGAKQWSDGTAARSCRAYREDVNYRGAGSGVYRLDTGRDTFSVYCDMRTDGGGWTMVGRYRHPATDNAPADLDSRDYAYFMRARSSGTHGRAEYFANPDAAGAWTDWRPLDGMGWPVEFAVVLNNGNWSDGWEATAAKTIYRVKSRDVMPNYGTVQNMLSGDNLLYKLNPADDWTDIGGNSSSGTYYWYPRDSAGRNLTLFHVSNYRYLGEGATNYHYTSYYGVGMPGGVNDWHYGARLLVRELAAPLGDADGKRLVRDAEGVRQYSDGSLETTCRKYRRGEFYRGDTGDGRYRVATASGNIVVYCDMTSDGGGWTMLGYYKHPATSNGPPDLDARDYEYFMRARTSAAYGNAVDLANPDSAGPWTDWRPLDRMGWPAELAVVFDNGFFETGWDAAQRKVIYLVKHRGVMPNYGTSQNLASDDNMLYKLNPADAWTDVGESSRSGAYYWYPNDSRDRHLSLMHASNYRYIDGGDPSSYHYSFYYGAGMIGGINDWHFGGRLLIRETAEPIAEDARRVVIGPDGARRFSDGALEVSCKRYRRHADYRGEIGDGLYRIRTGAGDVNVYCDMHTDGGGWTMVANYKHPSTTNAPPDLDLRDYAYFMRARTNAAYGRAQFVGDPNSDGVWTDWRPLTSVRFPLEMAVVLDQGADNFFSGWEEYGRKVIYRVRTREQMPNYGTEQDLRTGDNLLYRFRFNENWTDVANNSASGHYYWYPNAANGNHLSLLHVSNYFYLDGRAPSNYHHGFYYGAGMPGGVNDWHYQGRMLVRELD